MKSSVKVRFPVAPLEKKAVRVNLAAFFVSGRGSETVNWASARYASEYKQYVHVRSTRFCRAGNIPVNPLVVRHIHPESPAVSDFKRLTALP